MTRFKRFVSSMGRAIPSDLPEPYEDFLTLNAIEVYPELPAVAYYFGNHTIMVNWYNRDGSIQTFVFV